MPKNKKILMMLAKGGTSQADIATALHVSKRDVSAGAKATREYGLTFDAVASMDADVVDDLFFPKEEREPNGAYLQHADCAESGTGFHVGLVHRSGMRWYGPMYAGLGNQLLPSKAA